MLAPKTKFFTVMLGIGFGGMVLAQQGVPPEGEDSDDGPLELGEFPGILIDEVVVPVPSEIFSIMAKLGEGRFEGEIADRRELRSRDRSCLALALGVVVADGFIAVQAQNRQAIEECGRSALALAEALGLKDRVLRHTNAIIGAAQAGAWGEVRKELDRTQKTVRDTMEEMRDADLANCVSIGGWIRGTEAMSSLVSQAYKIDQAELLNQPELAKHFSKLIDGMDGAVRGIEQVTAAGACLAKIGTLMGDGEVLIGGEAIDGIHAASAAFVGAIFADGSEQGGKP